MKASLFSNLHRLFFAALCGGFFCIAQGAGPKGTILSFTIPDKYQMNSPAQYFCWVPDGTDPIRCVIVHQHGCGIEGDATLMPNDVQWTTFAKKWHAAFVSPMMQSVSITACRAWFDINNGSGKAFLQMLDTLGKRTKHPEISRVPWALWGHSGGAYWVMDMERTFPSRIAGIVAVSWGVDISNVPATYRIPLLLANSKVDIAPTDEFYNPLRPKGALCAHAVNPNPTQTDEGHHVHDVRMLAIPWLDYALESRLPLTAGDSALRPMDTSNAWLGDQTTMAISSSAAFTGNKLSQCWLPNRTFADMWVQYMKKGTLTDSTPPPAPYNLTGTYASGKLTLKWDADADMQTGIKTFIVYRNGTLFRTLKYPTVTAFSSIPGYQRWEIIDAPNPTPAPAMTCADSTIAASDTGTYSYQMSTVNWSDVSGPKSEAIVLKQGMVTSVKSETAGPIFSRPPATFCWNVDNGRVSNLVPGIVDIFDIRGRLLKTSIMKAGDKADAASFLGNRTERIVVVRNRTLIR
jgi:pimeloyl-ACP methyl ester carboxylesterase